jgi:hypothetical protein
MLTSGIFQVTFFFIALNVDNKRGPPEDDLIFTMMKTQPGAAALHVMFNRYCAFGMVAGAYSGRNITG